MTLEERIKQMLEESNKQLVSLSEEDLDAMTQEEFDSIDEEQLDELSKELLQRYAKPAGASYGKAVTAKTAIGMVKSRPDYETAVSDDQKSQIDAIEKKQTLNLKNRTAGIARATNKLTKESSEVSSQVSALLEAEGLSEEFKLQAVTIFEAAVTDRVLQLQEELEAQYNEKLDEATAENENNIDGFLNEAVQEWADNNEVAIAANFKSRLAESFMDGMKALIAEHNIDLPEESEDALEIALTQVAQLEESAEKVETTIASLQEEVAQLKAEKILESFKEKMTSTEFDRFAQLTESVKFQNETQYEKQLTIVLENFGKIAPKKVATEPKQIVEETVEVPQTQTIVVESDSNVNVYAKYLQSRAGK